MSEPIKKIPWATIILSIIYVIIVGIAIFLSIKTKSSYAFNSNVTLAFIATVVCVINLFTLDKTESDEKHKQSLAGFAFMHLILWGAILFLPFGDYPKISLAVLILFAINEAGLTSTLSAEEKSKKSKEGMSSIAGHAIKIALWLVVIIVVLHLFKEFSGDKKISDFFKSIKTEVGNNSKSNEESIIDGGGYNLEDERSGNMIATIKGYKSPLDFGKETPFISTAEGEINLNSTSDAAVNVTIYFKHSGDIILDNGTVQIANEKGGQITGTWSQPKSGLSGSYLIDVVCDPEAMHNIDDLNSAYAVVDLEYGGQNITTIELVSN